MPGFSRPVGGWRFDFSGLCLNDPADAIDAKQYPVAINIRAIDDQSIRTRPGYSPLVNELEITTICPIESGVVGIPYSSFLTAVGGVAPYTWEIVYGELPDGLTLDEDTGEVSGTPTQQGTFEWTAQVTDALGNTALLVCSNTIELTIAITTTCPDDEPQVDEPYEYQFEAIGGTPPYHWAIVYGELPDGLTLDPDTGLISGTPTETGLFEWIIEVTDSEYNSDSLSCSLTVSDTAGIIRPTTVTLDPAPGPGIRGTIDDPEAAFDQDEGTYCHMTISGGTAFSTFAMAHYQDWAPIPADWTGVVSITFRFLVRRSYGDNGAGPGTDIGSFETINTDPDVGGGPPTPSLGGEYDWTWIESIVPIGLVDDALTAGTFTLRVDQVHRLGNFAEEFPSFDIAEMYGVLNSA